MENENDIFFYYVGELTKIVQSIIDKKEVAENVFICFDQSSKKFYIDRDVTDSESRPAFMLKWLVRMNNRAIWEPNDASILSTAGIIEEEYTK